MHAVVDPLSANLTPLPADIEALLAGAGPRVPQARAALSILASLAPDRDMQVATVLATLGDAAPAGDWPLGVRTLLDGLRAADQVWALHARQEGNANAEGLRRLLLAIVRDLRVVPVLMALQLARLRDAARLPEAERIALARQAQDILAPLANRLGVWQLKWEIEDLAFRFLQPEVYQRIARLLDEKRTSREQYIQAVRLRLRESLAAAGIAAEVDGRPKHICSIWKKMQRKGVPFGELYDIRAVRVLVGDIAQCYAALGVVHQLWVPVPQEFDDYIAKPKGNNYRSLHTAVIGPEGRTLEVQIRTREMHEQAELGVAAHWRYKEGGGADAAFDRKIAWMRQLLDAGEASSFAEGLRTDLIEDRVYLLTPQGEVVDLPKGATVLDFAYAVHTEVGHRCRGAKVGGRIVPLDFQPDSGQQVEILTGKESSPRRDWLVPANGFLSTGRARDKVRAWFHKLDRARNLADGEELLDKELRKVALVGADLGPILERFRLGSIDELHIALALGDITPAQVSRALHEQAQPKEPSQPLSPTTRPTTDKGAGKDAFVVEGMGNLLTQLARCCQPVPGDAIHGYITRGRGISVHREDCQALHRMMFRHPERAVPVAWGRAHGGYPVDIRVIALDRRSLLKDISHVIAQEGVHILAVTSRLDDARGLADLRLGLRINDFGQLSHVLGRLSAIPGVKEACRVGA